LYVLFFLSLAYYGLRRLGVPRIGVLAIAAVLHAGHLYTDVPLVSWVYHECCKHGLYLAGGAVATAWYERGAIPWARSVTVRLLASALGYALIAAAVARDWPLGATLLACVGIAASVALASVLAGYRAAPFLEMWGQLSLQIYVAHTIVAAAVRTALLHLGVRDPATHIVAQTAIGIYGPIALAEVCKKCGCDWLFTLRRPQPARTEQPSEQPA
jgi:peptidoglycan/LPS O-acetylase OafA/YrhL